MAARRSRTLSAQDRKFIAETEAVAHMKLDEPGLDLNDRELTDFRRQTTASREARIHDTTDHVMGFLSDVTRGTLAGGVIDSARNVRQDARSVAYGTRNQRNSALLSLGVDVATPAVFGVAGRAAEAIAPTVSRLGMWGRGVLEGFKAPKEISPFDLNVTQGRTMGKNAFKKFTNEDIKVNGIKETIKYVEYDGQKFVVDGHHRLDAAKILGMNKVPVEKVRLPHKGYHKVEDLEYFGNNI